MCDVDRLPKWDGNRHINLLRQEILKNPNVVQVPQLLDLDRANFNAGYAVALICDKFD